MKKIQSRKGPAPLLKQFGNLWTLNGYPSPSKEWTREEKIKRIKAAGFEAVGGCFTAEDVPLLQKHGMQSIHYFDGSLKNYRQRLEAASIIRPARIDMQACDHDTPPAEAVKVWQKAEALAEKMGLAIDLEVHRDTATETPEKVYAIAALYQKATGRKVRFCWDFSHLAVIKHLEPPFAPALLVRPDLVQLSRQLHFRPFNGQHVQVPITDGKGNRTLECQPYLDFVDAVIACWMDGAQGGEVLYACPEFGPANSSYGLSVFSDPWKDTILLRSLVDAIWKKHLRRYKWAS